MIAQYLYGYLLIRNKRNRGKRGVGGWVLELCCINKIQKDYVNYKVHNLAETKSRSDGQKTSHLSGEQKV